MLCVVILILGCSVARIFYRVTDPQTGKVYFTTKVQQRSSGAVTLTDADTGATVTVQNSELETISSEAFKERFVPEPETPEQPAEPIEAEDAEVEETSSEESEEISAPEPETPAEPMEADDTE